MSSEKSNQDKSKDDKTVLAKNMLTRIMDTIRAESISLRNAVMESAGLNQFERQIEDARLNLDEAKHALTEQMADELQSTRLVKILADRVNQQELLIIDALGVGDEDQAFTLATQMVELEHDLLAQQQIKKSHELHLSHLTRQMEQAERLLKDLERQLSMVNTTDRIQKATDVITRNFDQADSKLLSAKNALDRIRRKQHKVDEQYETPEFNAVSHPEIEVKHQDSANKNHAEMVLKRIKNKD